MSGISKDARPRRPGLAASIRAWWRTPMGTLTYNGNGGAVGVGSVRDVRPNRPQSSRVVGS